MDDFLTKTSIEFVHLVDFISFNVNSFANNSSHDVKDLHDKNLSKFILVNCPAKITIEFAKTIIFDKFELGGISGFSSADNLGRGAVVSSSKDNNKWKNIGVLPGGWENSIQIIKVKGTKAKYIRFEHNSSKIGIGYLNIIPITN